MRVLHAHVPTGPTDPVARPPVVIARPQVVGPGHGEAFTPGLDPAFLLAEAVVAGHRADGPPADDHPGAQLAEDGALGVEPGRLLEARVTPRLAATAAGRPRED